MSSSTGMVAMADTRKWCRELAPDCVPPNGLGRQSLRYSARAFNCFWFTSIQRGTSSTHTPGLGRIGRVVARQGRTPENPLGAGRRIAGSSHRSARDPHTKYVSTCGVWIKTYDSPIHAMHVKVSAGAFDRESGAVYTRVGENRDILRVGVSQTSPTQQLQTKGAQQLQIKTIKRHR